MTAFVKSELFMLVFSVSSPWYLNSNIIMRRTLASTLHIGPSTGNITAYISIRMYNTLSQKKTVNWSKKLEGYTGMIKGTSNIFVERLQELETVKFSPMLENDRLVCRRSAFQYQTSHQYIS